MNNLKQLGYSDWFKQQADDAQATSHGIARVIAVHKDSYTVSKGAEAVFAELSGNLLYSSESVLDLPTTGDWVYADFYDDDSHAIIYGVYPRKALLKRKTPGRRVDFQLVAANIDVAFIMQSLNENFNLRRLERYLVMVNESGIEPVILLSKADLMPAEEIAAIKAQVQEVAPGETVVAFSNINQENMDSINGLLQRGSTYCLLGSSGVGKTTLLNCIMGQEAFETKSVNRAGSGGQDSPVVAGGGCPGIQCPGTSQKIMRFFPVRHPFKNERLSALWQSPVGFGLTTGSVPHRNRLCIHRRRRLPLKRIGYRSVSSSVIGSKPLFNTEHQMTLLSQLERPDHRRLL